MASSKNESTIFALKIVDFLLYEPIKGFGTPEIAAQMKAARTTTHRALQTLEDAGWVEQIKIGTRAVNWKVSSQFLRAANQYRLAAQDELNRIKAEYKDITGTELNYE